MLESGAATGGVFFSVLSKPRGLFSFGRKHEKQLEETIDNLYHQYSANLNDGDVLAALDNPVLSPEQVKQSQVQKYVVPSGAFGLTVLPGVDAVTKELVRVHPYVHSEKESVVCFKGHLSNSGELQQRLHNWTSLEHAANNHMGDDACATTTSLLLELFHQCEGSNKELLFLSELQGHYAFVLYDGDRKCALAARDPSGEEELFYRVQEDGSVAFTNSLDLLPTGEDASKWQEFPPGHFISGKTHTLQQFALTPEQLHVRERHEALEDSRADHSDAEDGGPPSYSLLSRLSRRGSGRKTADH